MSFVRRHPVTIYFTAAFAVSWTAVALLSGPSHFPLSADTSAVPMPVLYTAMLLGPSTSSLALTAATDGAPGLRRLRQRLFTLRAPAGIWIMAVLGTPLLAAVVLSALSLATRDVERPATYVQAHPALLGSGLVAGVLVGALEELGWSGFAAPRLRERFGVAGTGLVIGVLWGAWHFPLFWEADTFSAPRPFVLLLLRLFGWLPAFRVLLVWLQERTKSLPVVMAAHASLVLGVTAIVPASMPRPALLAWLIAWSAVLAAAALVVARAKTKTG